MRGKAALSEIGARYDDMPELSKATLGTTGPTGGYVLPNNLVATLVKPAVTGFSYANLVTVRTGVNVRGVDQPFRTGAPSRATFQDWGSTKENVSEAYGSYTATLGTLARIYDVGKQYLRFSAGAAEQDVIDELTKAMRLGENFYVLAGAGTGSVGSGDPTYGI
jgi:HK97 family phage major capsid protein